MIYKFLLLLIASLSLASEVNLSTPIATVQTYYDAMNSADINSLKKSMVQDSFDMDMQVYALSIALNDKTFHKVLKQYSKNQTAKDIVIKKVEKKLQKRKKRTIKIDKEISMGKDRVMVKFFENSNNKQLYLSYKNKQWKINYQAGRKLD